MTRMITTKQRAARQRNIEIARRAARKGVKRVTGTKHRNTEKTMKVAMKP
jgi:hypothetical protein